MEFKCIIRFGHVNEISNNINKNKGAGVISELLMQDREESVVTTVWRNWIAGQIWCRLIQLSEGEQ